ncbi:MAG: hypothetical protein CSYNP_03569 [Syntrophus sp. SKADARSKE-3]|nr:hypothetical protein [Syntrophus sp. SKADARSKE-3]
MNLTSMSDHGRCHDCQKAWVNGEFEEEDDYKMNTTMKKLPNGATEITRKRVDADKEIVLAS